MSFSKWGPMFKPSVNGNSVRWRLLKCAGFLFLVWQGLFGCFFQPKTQISGRPQQNALNRADVSLGNVSVPFLFESWGSPIAQNIISQYGSIANYHQITFEQILNGGSTIKVPSVGIEDYIGWGVVEPTEGQFNWSVYKENARRIRSQGYLYVPYIFIQNLPAWVRNNNAYPRATNVETHLATDSLSIFAQKTKDSYNHFYARLKQEMGAEIDILRFSSPNDFGEIHYPSGAADFAFPLKNMTAGFWVDEPEARAHFQSKMTAKYGTIGGLNAAWSTGFASFNAINYPANVASRRYWLDFVSWYAEALTEKTAEFLDVVKSHFPRTPINVNIGFPYEKINLGHDITGIVKMSAAKKVLLRGPTGASVPFLYTKRVSTAVRHYKPEIFSSEPAADQSKEQTALALFKDLTTGVQWHFDYLPNVQAVGENFAQYLSLRPLSYPLVDMAVFYPTTSHRLDNWDNWRSADFTGGFPSGLMEFAEMARDLVDYDVIDERLVEDNALQAYKILVWPVGATVEASILTKIRDWVNVGGVLLIADLDNVKTVEGTQGAFAELSALPRQSGMSRLGGGYIFIGNGQHPSLLPFIKNRSNLRAINSAYPVSISALPAIDTAEDHVLTSIYPQGILLFNQTSAEVTKSFSTFSIPGLPSSVQIQPYSMKWIPVAIPGAQ
jgi:hypothetical protein